MALCTSTQRIAIATRAGGFEIVCFSLRPEPRNEAMEEIVLIYIEHLSDCYIDDIFKPM